MEKRVADLERRLDHYRALVGSTRADWAHYERSLGPASAPAALPARLLLSFSRGAKRWRDRHADGGCLLRTRLQVLPSLPPGATLDQAVAMAAARIGSAAGVTPQPRNALGSLAPQPPRPARPPHAAGETTEQQAGPSAAAPARSAGRRSQAP